MSSFTARVDLLPVDGDVPLARHVTVDVLRSWGSPHDLDDAALLVSELVSNVVDHAHTETALTLDRPRGRGLQLVEAIADRWGVEDHHGGKRIWFELTPALR